MVTYLKRNTPKKYVVFETELDPMLYTNIGSTYEDYINNMWIKLSDEQLSFKDNNPTASIEEVFKMELRPIVEVDNVLIEKNRMLEKIKEYDSSDKVNILYVNNYPIWLDKSTRVGLKLRFESEIAMGMSETSLWYENLQFPISLENAMQLLYAIEIYASACYDNTQKHLSEVMKLQTVEDIQNYNYKYGYPEKLKFTL